MVVRPAYDVWFGEVGNNKKTGGRAEVSLILLGWTKLHMSVASEGPLRLRSLEPELKRHKIEMVWMLKEG